MDDVQNVQEKEHLTHRLAAKEEEEDDGIEMKITGRKPSDP